VRVDRLGAGDTLVDADTEGHAELVREFPKTRGMT
jgi:hypothetical protein